MKLEHDKLTLSTHGGYWGNDGYVELHKNGARLVLTPDDLRWLCLIAGPALLAYMQNCVNELEKEAKDGDG